MQTITTCWHGEVWWFRVHLATNITFIVFFLTSSLHPLSPGIFTVCGSFGQLAALLCHDSTVSTVKHGLASSSLCYHLQLWCFMYDILVSLIYKLESWEFDTLLCQKKERTRICHAKRWPTTNKFFISFHTCDNDGWHAAMSDGQEIDRNDKGWTDMMNVGQYCRSMPFYDNAIWSTTFKDEEGVGKASSKSLFSFFYYIQS